MLIKKIPDANGLVTTTVLNRKINEVENKIPDISGLVTTLMFLIQKLVKLKIKFLIMLNLSLLKSLIS